MERYYSTQRPVGLGTFPKPKGNEILEIRDFGYKEYAKEIGRDAYGYVVYERPLSEKDVWNYELVKWEK